MIRIKKTIYYMILVFMVTSLFFGCGGNKKGEIHQQQDHFDQINMPAMGGQITIPIIQFDTLNPIINDNKSVYHLEKLIYEGLISFNENLEPQPALAKSWTLSPRGDEWVFELRENVNWQDGKPLTPEDVKFTIDTLRESRKGSKKSVFEFYVQHIVATKIIKPNKISVKFDSPLNSWIEAFTFPIIPKHQFKNSEDVYKMSNIIPIGTGPYKVKVYDKYNHVEMVRNDNYWGSKPYITKIYAKIVPDKEAALSLVEANEMDLAEANDFDWEKYAGDKSIKIYEYITSEYEYLGFNFNREMLRDKNIRYAICYGINKHQIINEVYLGHATATDVPIHPNSMLFDEETQIFGEDKDKAKRLLSESNWVNRDIDPWLENESGQELKLSLLVNEDNPQRMKAASILASQLKEIGMNIVVEKVSWDVYRERVYANKFDIVLSGWNLSIMPDFRFMLHSNYIGNTNFIGYINPEMDRILDETALSKSPQLQKEKYRQFQRFFIEESPYCSLYFKNNSLIMKNRIKGNVSPSFHNLYNQIQNWYIYIKE